MPSFPSLIGAQRFETAGADTAASNGTTLTSGTANNKGTFVQLIASTAFASMGFLIQTGFGTGAVDQMFDIATGAGDNVIVSNLVFCGNNGIGQNLYIPIPIPAGTRMSASNQSTGAASTMELSVVLVAQGLTGFAGLGRCTTYGAVTASTTGVAMDPGAVANTKTAGAFTEITSSTTNAIKYLIVGIGNKTNFVRSNFEWLTDIGIGASGSETVLVPNLYMAGTTATDVIMPRYFALPCNVPAGTRLSAKSQCSGTDATDRLFDIVLYGVD